MENLSKEESIEELIIVGDITSKLFDLSNRFDDFLTRFDEELKLNICKALSLSVHGVKPDNLQACHRLKKKELVIVKFKRSKLKRRVLVNRKNLRNKSEDLHQLKPSAGI